MSHVVWCITHTVNNTILLLFLYRRMSNGNIINTAILINHAKITPTPFPSINNYRKHSRIVYIDIVHCIVYCIMYIVHCIIFNVYCTYDWDILTNYIYSYIVIFMLQKNEKSFYFGILNYVYRLYIVHYIIYSVHYIMYNVYCILYIVQCHHYAYGIFCTLPFILYNVQCTLSTA